MSGVYDADMILQGHETESTASKASGLYEAWRLSSKDARPFVKMPLRNLPLPSLALPGLKLRLPGLLDNDLL
jgi:hypothetical protein